MCDFFPTFIFLPYVFLKFECYLLSKEGKSKPKKYKVKQTHKANNKKK